MKVGYARVSSTDQDLAVQLDRLQLEGCDKVYCEKVSGISSIDRPELQKALAFVREGDIFVITKIDRLARSLVDLLNIVEGFQKDGILFKALDMDLDYSTPTGRLVLGVLGSVAAFELQIRADRCAEGIARAKALGKFTGRKPVSQKILSQVMPLIERGMTRKEVAAELGISLSMVSKTLKKLREKGGE